MCWVYTVQQRATEPCPVSSSYYCGMPAKLYKSLIQLPFHTLFIYTHLLLFCEVFDTMLPPIFD
uniref:Uncharacterized protein n=1 Tax=Anguilla anguilla TaxID=7936 RepID=A0A0E9UK14_ANGAN